MTLVAPPDEAAPDPSDDEPPTPLTPPTPTGNRARTDAPDGRRRRIIGAVLAFALLVNAVNLVRWRVAVTSAADDRAAAATAAAHAEGYTDQRARAEPSLVTFGAEVTSLQAGVAAARNRLQQAVTDRDLTLIALRQTQDRLAFARFGAALTVNRIFAQAAVVNDLRSCFNGANRALMDVALGLRGFADIELLAVMEPCTRARAALPGLVSTS